MADFRRLRMDGRVSLGLVQAEDGALLKYLATTAMSVVNQLILLPVFCNLEPQGITI